ncbi:hypothetical protein [Thiobacillus denitrificans]|uniref:Transmembrane protein n=1 Tax=Thiobacillus denitrificans TaxID=36861 RepID=A0A106BLF9_THIDE|nr:hypothetical protein [Thiobacillus denitrificans]KVW94646.1 hypothetical protein ABW22_11375 [Thiobacillus denitrificans]
MSAGRDVASGIILRLLIWLPVLLWAAWAWGWHYAVFWLPVYQRVLDGALPDFGVVYLGIALGHEYVFDTQVMAERALLVQGHILPAGLTVNASTPMYAALIHPIVLVASALAWPLPNWRARLLRLLLSLPFLFVLEALDVPLVLASSISDLLSYSLDPGADAASMRVDWTHVMNGGGRFALSLAMAFAAALLHKPFESHRS